MRMLIKTVAIMSFGCFMALSVNAEESGVPGAPDDPSIILEGSDEHLTNLRDVNFGTLSRSEARVKAAKEAAADAADSDGLTERLANDPNIQATQE